MYCYIDFCQILAIATRALGLRIYCYVGRLFNHYIEQKNSLDLANIAIFPIHKYNNLCCVHVLISVYWYKNIQLKR